MAYIKFSVIKNMSRDDNVNKLKTNTKRFKLKTFAKF